MNTIELQRFGREGLVATDRAMPRPGPGEVLLRLRAATLNHRDLEIVEGRYGMPVQLPIVPVSDAVGEVLALGEGVSRVAVGDRASPVFFPDWIEGPFHGAYFARQLGATLDGMLRRFAVLPEAALVRMPAHLSDEGAAALPIAGLTAWMALTDAALSPGQSVLVIGSGAVSLFALQFARIFGARAIAVTSTEEKAARLKALGASDVIVSRRTPDWGTAAHALAGEGVDLVVEVGGAATLPQSTAALRVGGTMAIVGYVSGPRLDFDLRPLFIGRRARLHGHTVGSRAGFEAMNRAIALHRLEPVIDRCFPMSETAAALDYLASGRAFGKVAIRIAEERRGPAA